MGLAEQAGLSELIGQRVRFKTSRVASAGANPAGKRTSIAGMAADSNSIDDLDVIRSCGMPRLFGGVYAPATLGQFLREFRHGHTLQLASGAAGPPAVPDPDTGELISVAEVAEVAEFTAFGSTDEPVTARLIVRRVRDRTRLEELFPVWRHHPLLTNSLEPAAITHYLLEAVGTLASPAHAAAHGATLRGDLITVPALGVLHPVG